MLVNFQGKITNNKKRDDVEVRDRHYILQIPEGT
jgi:hypothetical protein